MHAFLGGYKSAHIVFTHACDSGAHLFLGGIQKRAHRFIRTCVIHAHVSTGRIQKGANIFIRTRLIYAYVSGGIQRRAHTFVRTLEIFAPLFAVHKSGHLVFTQGRNIAYVSRRYTNEDTLFYTHAHNSCAHFSGVYKSARSSYAQGVW